MNVSADSICPLCMEPAGHAAEGCPEADCPFAPGRVAGAEREIYPELARANLYRMRGHYREAADLCRSILKRQPGNATAHALLGDIHAEQNELETAAEWYELALELNPGSESEQLKLATVRKRIEDRQTAEAAHQLGIPRSPSKARFMALALGAFVVLTGILAFFAGQRNMAPRRAAEPIETPIVLADAPTKPPVAPPDATRQEPVNSGLQTAATAEETAALSKLRQVPVLGVQVLDARIDPRDQTMALTAQLPANAEPKAFATQLANEALQAFQACAKVDVRVFSQDRLVLIATLARPQPAPAGATTGAPATQPPAQASLTNVWEAPAQTPSDQTAPR